MIFTETYPIHIQTFLRHTKGIRAHRCYFIIKRLIESYIQDGLDPSGIDKHDKLFTPKDENEKKFWETCREEAKKDMKVMQKIVEGGKLGGRPKKTIDYAEKNS